MPFAGGARDFLRGGRRTALCGPWPGECEALRLAPETGRQRVTQRK